MKKPIILCINKLDKIKQQKALHLIETYKKHFPFNVCVPISAKRGSNLSILVGEIINFLPFHPPYYSSDTITDQMERVLVAELIREKIFELTRQEIPYSVMTKVEEFTERSDNLIYISATIYVEHSSQKGIIIGKKGSMIKKIGQLARREIENRLGCRIYLDLRVGVKKNWRKNIESLKEIGFDKIK